MTFGVNARGFDFGLAANSASRSRVNCRFRYFGNGRFLSEGEFLAHVISMRSINISRPPGEMASRLTTNQEIAGSTPAVVIWFIFVFLFCRGNSRLTASNWRSSTGSRRDLQRLETPLFLLTILFAIAMRVTQICRFPERLLSTVHRGTAFEYRALALLTKHMSMSLAHVGGSYDGGVDLIGWWWVPSENHTTRACRVYTLNVLLGHKA